MDQAVMGLLVVEEALGLGVRVAILILHELVFGSRLLSFELLLEQVEVFPQQVLVSPHVLDFVRFHSLLIFLHMGLEDFPKMLDHHD